MSSNVNDLNTAITPDTPFEEYLYRLGNLKTNGLINATWEDLTSILNNTFGFNHVESSYRRKYNKLKAERALRPCEEEEKTDKTDEIYPEKTNRDHASEMREEDAALDDSAIVKFFREIDKERVRARDERISYARQIREDARRDEFFELLRNEIKRADPVPRVAPVGGKSASSVYALLGDLHYGITYSNASGEYNPELAKVRVMHYANEIIRIGKENKCDECFVSLLGDMISGNIHTTTRIENRCDVVTQVIGVSELVAAFLYELAKNFRHVYANSVPGNHSRLDANYDNTLRNERLDNLVTFYCKTKLENVRNVTFNENAFDSTVGLFCIRGCYYASVHGDMDPDMRASASRISNQLSTPLTGLMLGHLHVPTFIQEDVAYVRNGCVCGSGDEYTMKKRLFGPASQVCLVCGERGIMQYNIVEL